LARRFKALPRLTNGGQGLDDSAACTASPPTASSVTRNVAEREKPDRTTILVDDGQTPNLLLAHERLCIFYGICSAA
jgi:hypothetical protein